MRAKQHTHRGELGLSPVWAQAKTKGSKQQETKHNHRKILMGEKVKNSVTASQCVDSVIAFLCVRARVHVYTSVCIYTDQP